MYLILAIVLLFVMTLKGVRWSATRLGEVSGYDPAHDGELPADYGLDPQRPWERRPRGLALQTSLE